MTLRFGLNESTIENICAVFARYPQVEKAVLYGSRAKGNYKNGSDIDGVPGQFVSVLERFNQSLFFEFIQRAFLNKFCQLVERFGKMFKPLNPADVMLGRHLCLQMSINISCCSNSSRLIAPNTRSKVLYLLSVIPSHRS